MKILKFLLVIVVSIYTLSIVNAHYTYCAGGPDAGNVGLCEWKEDRSHGYDCNAGRCLTFSPYSFVATCDCIGTVTTDQIKRIQ